MLQVCAGMKEVRDRMASVKNTQKITEAMKLVAAAKVRRAQDAVINSRPFTENLVKVSPTGVNLPACGCMGTWHMGTYRICACTGAHAHVTGISPSAGAQCTATHTAGNADVSALIWPAWYRTQVLYGVNQRLRTEDVDSPLCNIRPVKTVMLVVLTGDRGLCGGYNNFILKKVRAAWETLRATPCTC